MSYLDNKPYKLNHLNLNPLQEQYAPDCSIRAIMIATGKTTPGDWLKIYDDLYKLSILRFKIFNSTDNIALYLSYLDFELYFRPKKKESYTNKYNNIDEKITVNNFIKEHMVGTYIIFVPNHMFAVIDGVVYERSKLDFMVRSKYKPRYHITAIKSFFETYIDGYAVKKGN